MGGAVRRPRQAERVDGKLPAPSSALRVSLPDADVRQSLTPLVKR